MAVFLTTQKKLAAAVGVTPEHLSKAKAGVHGVSDDLAGRLETVTGIEKIKWTGKGKKQLQISLKRFFREERDREMCALKKGITREMWR